MRGRSMVVTSIDLRDKVQPRALGVGRGRLEDSHAPFDAAALGNADIAFARIPSTQPLKAAGGCLREDDL